MRARYSAYVRHDADFLLRTEAGSGLDTGGVVEFRARFRRGNEYLELHETSRFARVDGDWAYLDGS